MSIPSTKEEIHYRNNKYIVGEKANGEFFYRKKWVGIYDGVTDWDKIEFNELPKYVIDDLEDNVLDRISKQLI